MARQVDRRRLAEWRQRLQRFEKAGLTDLAVFDLIEGMHVGSRAIPRPEDRRPVGTTASGPLRLTSRRNSTPFTSQGHGIMIMRNMKIGVAVVVAALATGADAWAGQSWLCSIASAVAVDEDGVVWSVFGHALRDEDRK